MYMGLFDGLLGWLLTSWAVRISFLMCTCRMGAVSWWSHRRRDSPWWWNICWRMVPIPTWLTRWVVTHKFMRTLIDSCEYGHQLVQFNNSVAPIPPIF